VKFQPGCKPMKLSRPTGVGIINFLLDTSQIYHVVCPVKSDGPHLGPGVSHPTVVRTFLYHTERHQYGHGKTLIHWWCSLANEHSVAVRKCQRIQRNGCDLFWLLNDYKSESDVFQNASCDQRVIGVWLSHSFVWSNTFKLILIWNEREIRE
jgi:hypothetical protein